MIDIPKSLDKHKKFLSENCSLMDSISPSRVSDILLEHIQQSKDGKLLLLLSKGYDEKEYFIPELDDIPSCFLGNVWTNCSIEEKIKITDKYLDYFFQNCPEIRPTLQLISESRNSQNIDTLGYYMRSTKRLYVNFDKLIGNSGISFLSVLYHECTHAKDFNLIEKEIMPELLQNYSNVSSDTIKHPLLCDEYIMRMSANGFAQNKHTGEKKLIDGKLKNDILRAKNYYCIFESSDITNPSEVASKADFQKYLQTVFYYYSPLERFARTSVKRYFKEQLKNDKCKSIADEYYMMAQVESEKNVDSMLEDFKELLVINGETIVDMKDLLDLAMQYKFYQKPCYFGQSNSMKFPQEAERVKVTYENLINQIYNNLLMKSYEDPEKFGNPKRKLGHSLDDDIDGM